ncbi:MAG: hypothetical protein ACFFCV_07205 [Promethearchaeota archaeon]
MNIQKGYQEINLNGINEEGMKEAVRLYEELEGNGMLEKLELVRYIKKESIKDRVFKNLEEMNRKEVHSEIKRFLRLIRNKPTITSLLDAFEVCKCRLIEIELTHNIDLSQLRNEIEIEDKEDINIEFSLIYHKLASMNPDYVVITPRKLIKYKVIDPSFLYNIYFERTNKKKEYK